MKRKMCKTNSIVNRHPISHKQALRVDFCMRIKQMFGMAHLALLKHRELRQMTRITFLNKYAGKTGIFHYSLDGETYLYRVRLPTAESEGVDWHCYRDAHTFLKDAPLAGT
jgi:hypothetical protein